MDEQQLRAELVRRAADADVSEGARERVLVGVRPRRRWVRPVLAASLAVAATVASIALLTRDVAVPPSVDPAAPSVPTSAEPIAGEWRPESWGGLTVDVPADWGWSAAPIGRNLLCDERPDAPGYVGRPVGLTDLCSTYVEGSFPNGERAPYVWLGTELEPGIVDLPGEGWAQETVVVEGVTLTVATDDAELRTAVLASARPTELCVPELPGAPEPDESGGTEGAFGMEPEQLTVCAYRRIDGVVSLTYAAELDVAAPEAWSRLVNAPHTLFRCTVQGSGDEWVVLRFSGPGPFGPELLFADAVLFLRGHVCPRGVLGDKPFALTPGLIKPWAVGGIPYVVYGPTGGKGGMLDHFIGAMG